MSEGLVVIGDCFVIGCNAERPRDLQSILALRQLPQPAEQSLGRTPGEHDALGIAHPECGPREHR